MKAKMGSLVLLLWIVAGVHASVDYRNETIECVFQKYAACYRDIPTLGANFTARYDQTVAEMTATCRAASKVETCVSNVADFCHSTPVFSITNRISGFIRSLCTNKTTDQSNFLNASVCYNQYYHKRYECVNKYDAGNKMDAKSLCCSNMKTLRCMEEDLRSVCPRNYTEFQGRLVEIYRSYDTFVCGPYLRYCGAAPRLMSAWAVLVVTILSIIAQRIH